MEVPQPYRHAVSPEAGMNLHAHQPAPVTEVAWLSGYADDTYYHEPFQQNLSKTMFQKRRLTDSGAAGSKADLNRCERVQRLPKNQLFNCLNPQQRGRESPMA